MNQTSDLEAVVQQVLGKKKYQQLDPDLVAFIASREIKKRASRKEAVKATTNKLHQVAWAYFEKQPPYGALLEQLAGLPQDIQAAQSRAFCMNLMQAHASTRERLPTLADFYPTLFEDIQPVQSILDLACGFNPLALASMPVESSIAYTACDIFQDLQTFLQAFFDHFHIKGKAMLCNLLTQVPQQQAQVALLLKTLPCLEQADKDSTLRVLQGLQARYMVVSFPVRSIGGREKGMLANYSNQFESVLADLGWNHRKFVFASELVYRIEKGQ